jgi:catechol 2,3-dioxygenase-like lactoylglutathione lyase family enzyme
VEQRLEAVIIPVSDVDRAKAFYADRLGWAVDVDNQPSAAFRVVQLTPPGSACSILIGVGLGDAAPGAYRGTHLCVTDVEAARAALVDRGVAVGEVRHMTPDGWRPGPHPQHVDFGSVAELADPDGNTWVLQEKGHPDSPGTYGAAGAG